MTITPLMWRALASVALFCATDGILRFDPRFRKSGNLRYHAIHVLLNAVVVAGSFLDLVEVLRDPVGLCRGEQLRDNYLLVATVMLHVYHCVAFSGLRPVDWLHHILTAFVLGGIGLSMPYRHHINSLLFFISGLPGGIDYALLCCRELHWIEPFTEKRINRHLNMWCRLPGILMFSAYLYAGWIYGTCTTSTAFVVSSVLITVWNAIYFADLVVVNYGQNRERRKIVLKRLEELPADSEPYREFHRALCPSGSFARHGCSPQADLQQASARETYCLTYRDLLLVLVHVAKNPDDPSASHVSITTHAHHRNQGWASYVLARYSALLMNRHGSLVATVAADNKACLRLLEKSGFRQRRTGDEVTFRLDPAER